MRKNKVEIIDTKEKIATSFKELVCKKTFAKITITDIAKACNMTRENFYYHFRDKYDIVCWIFQKEIKEKLSENKESIEEWFHLFLHCIERDFEYYKRIFKVIDMTFLEQDMYQLFLEKMENELQSMPSNQGFRTEERKERFIAEFAASSCVSWIIKYTLTHDTMQKEEIINDFLYLFSRMHSTVRISEVFIQN